MVVVDGGSGLEKYEMECGRRRWVWMRAEADLMRSRCWWVVLSPAVYYCSSVRHDLD